MSVILVTTFQRPSRQKGRAYTAPGTRINNHIQQQTLVSSDTGTAKRKRSYSAFHPRNISTETLGQLLFISRHTASKHDGKLPEPQVTAYSRHQPAYVSAPVQFMRVEMKSLRKNVSKASSKLKADSRRDDSRHGDSQTHDRHLPQVSKLASIPDPPLPAESEEISTKLSITVTRSKTQRQQNSGGIGCRAPSTTHHSPEKTGDGTSPSTITTNEAAAPHNSSLLNVVSIGENKGVTQITMPRSRHQASGKGRLSHGWSPPQPIGPLKGSPIHKRLSASTPAGSQDKPGGVSPTASMRIDINVNEFLSEQTDKN